VGGVPVSVPPGKPPKSSHPLPVTPLSGSSMAANADVGKAVNKRIKASIMLNILIFVLQTYFIERYSPLN
jgi:hypothetical protein